MLRPDETKAVFSHIVHVKISPNETTLISNEGESSVNKQQSCSATVNSHNCKKSKAETHWTTHCLHFDQKDKRTKRRAHLNLSISFTAFFTFCDSFSLCGMIDVMDLTLDTEANATFSRRSVHYVFPPKISLELPWELVCVSFFFLSFFFSGKPSPEKLGNDSQNQTCKTVWSMGLRLGPRSYNQKWRRDWTTNKCSVCWRNIERREEERSLTWGKSFLTN